MGLVWDCEIVDPAIILTFLALADHAENDGTKVWPSIKTLSKKTRFSERTVQRHVRFLCEKGFLRCVKAELWAEKRPREYVIDLKKLGYDRCHSVTGPVSPVTFETGDRCHLKQGPVTNDASGHVAIVTRSVSSTDPSIDPSVQRSVSVPPTSLTPEIDYWNATGDFPVIRALSPGRKKHLQVRRQDPFWNTHWKVAIDRLTLSSFCKGKNDRGWKADFDWFLRPDTVAKIIEGKYDDREPITPTGQGGRPSERDYVSTGEILPLRGKAWREWEEEEARRANQ